MHGAIGSAYFLGWTLFSMFLPRYANTKGRKPVVLATFFMTTIAIAGIVFNKSLWIHFLLSLILGLFASGRISIAFTYMMEMLTPEWQGFVATIWSLFFVL